MSTRERFNQSQIESEELAKIAFEFAGRTHGGEVTKVCDLAGVVKDGVFYTGTVDGAGTKILIAQKLGSYYELGIDVFNSNINDLIRFGVEPKFALPTVSLGSKKEKEFRELTAGMTKASKDCGVPIIGGETEVLRSVFTSHDTINIAVAVFGQQEVSKLIIREGICSGDVVLVLPSSGLHTNGFSEIVKRFSEIDLKETLFDLSCDSDQTVQDWLTKPTANYLKDFKLLRETGIKINAAENVTGGGFLGRLSKLLGPTHFDVQIKEGSWLVPPIFDYLQQKFGWLQDLMYRTFNMGAGMLLIIDNANCDQAVEIMEKTGRKIFKIGEIK